MESLEGRESILAALLACQRRFQLILLAHGAHRERFADVLALAAQRNIPVKQVARKELDALAHGATHGGIVAIVSARTRLKAADLPSIFPQLSPPPLLLLLEGIDDARNLGFTLRSAEAMGACAVLVKKHLWDFDPVEVARPSSGAYERLPLVQLDDIKPLEDLKRQGLRLFGCVAGAKRTIFDADFTGGTIIAIGGEKRGLSSAVRQLCDRRLSIPTARPETSLSLSHAAAIVLAEAARQRRGKT